MTITITLAGIEAVITASGAGEAIEALLPDAARGRQLSAGTLLAGKMLALADGRPAHLTRAHQALTGLPERDRNGSASPKTGTTARTSSPTGRSSTLTG